MLKEITLEERTVVLYESTYRIIKLLKELNEFMPNRHLAVCREITKIYEEVLRGSASEIQAILTSEKQKGEFVVVIAPVGWEWEINITSQIRNHTKSNQS